MDYKKGGFSENDWTRKWDCDHFKINFVNNQCMVSTESDDLHPIVALTYGFVIGY